MALDCPAGGFININDIVDAINENETDINTKENNLGNPTEDNQILSSLMDGTRSWIPAPNSAVWGQITGTLSNQTDLQTELDTKISSSQENSVGNAIGNIIYLTQSEYDSLTPVDNTFYLIVG